MKIPFDGVHKVVIKADVAAELSELQERADLLESNINELSNLHENDVNELSKSIENLKILLYSLL